MSPQLGHSKLDGLPEDYAYADLGCDLAPSCLRCPFEQCRYDEPGGLRGAMRRQRDAELRAAKAQGAHPVELAVRFGVSIRSVYRVISARSG
jgi:hypothetical protein